MPIKLIGRTHGFHGKRLWEIVGCLKEFGVGRMVVRSKNEKYPEPSYFRILSARPEMDRGRPFMDEDFLRGKILVEKVFRGRNYGITDISKAAYKTDYRLIPKHEEHKYLEASQQLEEPEIKVLPQTIEMPPLLKIVAERENHESKELKLKICQNSTYRLAEEGEMPNVDVKPGLGVPANPDLYKSVLNN